MYKLVLLSLLFAAVSASIVGTPAIATWSAGPGLALSPGIATIAGPGLVRTSPIWAGAAPLAYGGPGVLGAPLLSGSAIIH
ncbi:cuticle protein LPCP-23-like [Zootermopsis nevadensis]|uniref:Uncharacterized protein n=1 Tax=Zootermopsis nevadensis TaxID=136037 RepID=A0A067RKK5_ZOONE|nr:cuticle protein LPCP-23-like [Zootermopsis nevadensis]KDR20020.1 hypothetical protein L798_05255 [Zootermopsis nevadensis]